MKYETVQRVQYGGTPDDLGSCLDRLMLALMDLENGDDSLTDVDLAATISERIVDVTMTVDADDTAEALVKALAALRAAIHSIGDGTPGWQTGSASMRAWPAGEVFHPV